MTIEETKPCQCEFRSGTIVKECDYHKRRETLFKTRLCQFLEARINLVFKDTYLYKVKEEVLNEINKVRTS